MSRYHFITSSPDTDAVSVYQILYMQAGFARHGIESSTTRNTLLSEIFSEFLMHLRLLRPVARLEETIYIVPLMGFKEYRLFPHTFTARLATYAFDVWPSDYPKWVRLFRRHRPVVAFITSKASMTYLQEAVPEVRFIWAPEAIDPSAYDPGRLLSERSIDVLELGRRFDAYHDAVTVGLAARKKSHRFAQTTGKKIFATRDDLVRGLASTKLLVCFPAAMTHAGAGYVETMTLRYLEACAAGCLPVGHAPAELIELFGYNPVVELDLNRALEHTLEILGDIEQWQSLVQKNHARMLQVATWDVRSSEVLEALRTHTGSTQ